MRAKVLAKLTPQEALSLLHDWHQWARPDQLAPECAWTIWLIQAGRGWGKSRTGAEWIIERASRPHRRLALVGRTAADVRDVMVEGESGILSISHPANRPKYFPSKRRLVWPNGTQATTYSADEPNLLRGPQHHDAWADEVAAWQYPDAWDQLQFGLRLGDDPRVVVTTTPRPTNLIRNIINDPATFRTRGRTQDNRANLARSFFTKIIAKYHGTRLGRQEIDGDLLEDTPGALWKRTVLDAYRFRHTLVDDPKGHEGQSLALVMPKLVRIVVAVDPSVAGDVLEAERNARASKSDDGERRGDECGIVVVGLGADGHAYVLQDATVSASPSEWAKIVVRLYTQYKANSIVAEANNGGDLIRTTLEAWCRDLKDSDGRRLMLPAIRLVHASKGKRARAEPIATHYEAGRVHHVGTFAELEDEMCTWEATTATKSPNRIDAVVWGLTDLLEGGGHGLIVPSSTSAHTRFESESRGF